MDPEQEKERQRVIKYWISELVNTIEKNTGKEIKTISTYPGPLHSNSHYTVTFFKSRNQGTHAPATLGDETESFCAGK